MAGDGIQMVTCPKCGFEQPGGATECGKCGIIFAKYQTKRQKASQIAPPPDNISSSVNESDKKAYLRKLLFHVNPEAGFVDIIGRAIILLILVVWGQKFIFSSIELNYSGESFMHNINLPFHEAGHIFFRPFGQLMMTLGGSLMQLLVPMICILTFLIKTKDPFAASVGVWWLGESMLDLAPYINDARALRLILVGGVTGQDVEDYHDWEYILRNLGWLQYDHLLAKMTHIIGSLLMICAFIWGGFLLIKQYRRCA